MAKSDLPFGSEFSPSQIQFPHVLDLAAKHGGDWRAFEASVRDAYFEGHDTSDYNKGKLANNTKLGMIAYGVIDREARLTEFGEKLHGLRADESGLYTEFARHILMNLNGMNMVQCVLDMQVADGSSWRCCSWPGPPWASSSSRWPRSLPMSVPSTLFRKRSRPPALSLPTTTHRGCGCVHRRGDLRNKSGLDGWLLQSLRDLAC